jgi:hypothetical protein
MFWFKRKKLVIDAFTTHAGVYNFYPITHMKDAYPDWWKKLPPAVNETTPYGVSVPMATIKKCDGLLALYARGFNIPLWTDLIIKTQTNGAYSYQVALNISASGGESEQHSFSQMGPEFNDLIHFKLCNAWNFSEKTGVEFHFTSAWWNQIKLLPYMHVPQAIVNYKYQISTEINLFFSKIDQTIELAAGQPMIQLIPLTEHDMDIRCHLISQQEMDKRNALHQNTTFQNSYKLKKRALQDKEKKCPFGFGKK